MTHGQNSGAHVELSPDGSFLYVSNRGHDSVGVFKVNPDTGALTLVTHALTTAPRRTTSTSTSKVAR